ncbi:MAG: replication-associated recombination protein A, partial [Mycobacteriales bacterium]
GKGYAYSQSDPAGVVEQQYPPDDLIGRDYYQPGRHGAEQDLAERVRRLRSRIRGTGEPGT